MDIRSLANQGYSHRQIARMCGLHRMTVKKYLTEGVLPVYKKVVRKSALEPYYGLIQGWLSQQDYQATRIHELVLIEGYAGSYDTVRRYVAGIKEQRDSKAYIRFETMPGPIIFWPSIPVRHLLIILPLKFSAFSSISQLRNLSTPIGS